MLYMLDQISGLYIISICCLFSSAFSQCHQYDPLASPKTSSVCSAFVSQEIIISPSVQATVDEQLSQDKLFTFIEDVKGVLPLNCYHTLVGIMCQNAFSTCVNVSNMDDSSFSFEAIPPCKSQCHAAVLTCNTTFTLTGYIPLNCSNFENSENCSTSIFPPLPFSSDPNPKVTKCPSVFGFRPYPSDNEALCDVRCPDPEYTIKELEDMAAIDLVVGVVSLVLSSFSVLSYLIDAKKREFPIRLQLYFCLAVVFLSIGPLLSGAHPHKSTICHDATTYSTQSNNNLCAAQGGIIFYFGFAASLWALSLAAVFYLTVVHQVPPHRIRRYELHFHVCAWGIGIVFLIVAGRLHLFDFSIPSRLYCFLHIDTTQTFGDENIIFYIPISILLVSVAILFGMVVVKVRTLDWNENIHNMEAWQTQYRVLFASVAVIVVFGIICVFHFAQNARETAKHYEEEYEWVACKVKAELFHKEYPPECNTDTNPKRRDAVNFVLANVGVSVLGIIAFLCFTTKKEIYQQWYILIHCIIRLHGKLAWFYIVDGFSENRPVTLSETPTKSGSDGSTPKVITSDSTSNENNVKTTSTTSSYEKYVNIMNSLYSRVILKVGFGFLDFRPGSSIFGLHPNIQIQFSGGPSSIDFIYIFFTLVE
eukprot:Phypoly_transcript_03996.p1 GENE.Phypoly_transcript_03996~~Phypoly_transcript_03996.p1  ORF type:complete len:647 (+),score=50.62 Phypoly_transcript_03996:29-1969(+)